MDDYIKREAVRDILADEFRLANAKEEKVIGRINYRVKAIPAADVVEVRHGWWRKVDIGADGKHHYKYACSVCQMCVPPNLLGYDDKLRYCPDCGAKMDGGVNDGT